MRRAISLAALALAASASARASAEEKRFDAMVFRPSAAPRDLVIVQKSEVIAHLSPVVGLYFDVGFNPLKLVTNNTTQETVNAIAAQVTFTPVVGIGFFNWLDVTAAIPLVAWQTGGNMRAIGSEGPISSSTVGDIRLMAKVGLPYFNRKDEIKSGFGMSLGAQVNLPTGKLKSFSSDGIVTGGPTVIFDYRFSFGLLVAANAGLWLRPNRQLTNIAIGNMGSFGVGAEAYVIQRYGISIIGEVYGYPSLTKFPDSPRDIPAEVLLGIRWQSKHGVTITTGGSFGAACGFGAPSVRLFNSITWQPEQSREQEEINRLQERDIDDPDHDGLVGDADRCPWAAGPPENRGCPDTDMDGDGVIDREDECPEVPAGPRGRRGCPTAYIKGDEIVIMDQVHFATDKDVILEDSKPVLEEVSKVLLSHPEIRGIQIEGHTDVRATDAYNMNLSQRRVNSVMKHLIGIGIDPARLEAKGYGHTQPVYDDSGCTGPDEQLSANCKLITSKNRRVVFRITQRGASGPKAITGAPDKGDSVLPTKQGALPSQNRGQGAVLPKAGVLPTKSTLPTSVLPQAGAAKSGMPTQQLKLPDKGVLPKQGTKKPPEPPAAPADAPKP